MGICPGSVKHFLQKTALPTGLKGYFYFQPLLAGWPCRMSRCKLKGMAADFLQLFELPATRQLVVNLMININLKEFEMVMGLTSSEVKILNQLCANIGNNIHKARINKKITIEKLSQITRLKTKTIEKYEMGTRNISFEVLLKLSIVLNVKFEEFFKT